MKNLKSLLILLLIVTFAIALKKLVTTEVASYTVEDTKTLLKIKRNQLPFDTRAITCNEVKYLFKRNKTCEEITWTINRCKLFCDDKSKFDGGFYFDSKNKSYF